MGLGKRPGGVTSSWRVHLGARGRVVGSGLGRESHRKGG